MRLKAKKSLVCAGVMAVAAGAIITTFAVTRDSAVMNNVFNIAKYETQFVEEFESPSNWSTCETVDKTIQVKNNTDTDIVARVKLEEEWNDKNNLGLPLVSNGSGERMAIVNLADNSGWTLDGTYYYSPTLAPGATSTSVITGVTLNCDANLDVDYRYAGAQYKLSANVETIQADRAPTEWHKISVWLPFSDVKAKIEAIRPYYTDGVRNQYSTKFLQADSLGIDLDDIGADNIISYYGEEGSNTYSYMWYDQGEDAVYWYSDANDVYMTNTTTVSGFGFADFSDLSGFYNVNTSRVTTFNSMFYYYVGSSLHGLEKWDVSHVTSLKDMFWTSSCESTGISDITALSRWDVSNVVDMSYVFSCQGSLEDISSLGGWNVRNVNTFYYMFTGTSVDSSICALADWPIKQSFPNGGGGFQMFYTKAKTAPVDARCLEPWNIESSSSWSWFNSYRNDFIVPSWAIH